MRHRSTYLAILGLVGIVRCFAENQAPESGLPAFKISIVDGDRGVNVIKKKMAVKPVVEVRDKNDLPLAGVLVAFLLPHGGPGGKFLSGSKEYSVLSDANGRATADAFRPLGKGEFKFTVRASYRGQTVTTTVTQVNFMTLAAVSKAGLVAGSSAHGATSATSVAGSGSAGSGAAGAAGAGVATGGGLSTAAIAGIAIGGAAAAGVGTAYATGAIGNKNSTSTDCTPAANTVVADANAEAQACSSGTVAQCRSAAQTALNALGGLCSCAGGSGSLPSDVQSLVQSLRSEASTLGLSLPSSCGF